MCGIYVASRVKHADMWKDLRRRFPIVSTWIDEAGEGETADFAELWERIDGEIENADVLVLYIQSEDDLPLKGALVEVGMALAYGVPVIAVVDGVNLEPRSLRPVGSWLRHPLVKRRLTLAGAMQEAEKYVCEDIGE